MRPDPLRTIELSVVDVTPKTRWIFVKVETEAGLRGAGEASLGGEEGAVADALDRLAPGALALSDTDPDRLPFPAPRSLAEAAAVSALDGALWDAAAQRWGVPVAAALGTLRRSAVPVYANVNRRTLDRSATGFAASARAALAAGHRWVKIAPFDEATAEARAAGGLAAAIEPGLGRIAAVRGRDGAGRPADGRLPLAARRGRGPPGDRGGGRVRRPLGRVPAARNCGADRSPRPSARGGEPPGRAPRRSRDRGRRRRLPALHRCGRLRRDDAGREVRRRPSAR